MLHDLCSGTHAETTTLGNRLRHCWANSKRQVQHSSLGGARFLAEVVLLSCFSVCDLLLRLHFFPLVLLDYWSYAAAHDIKYDPTTAHAISYSDLVACGGWQGLDIRPVSASGDLLIGDILLVRSGFVDLYYNHTDSENAQIALRPHFAER